MRDAMVRSERRHGGAHLRLIIDQPKANILTIAMVGALGRALIEAQQSPQVKLVTIEGAGDHFSYGASVEEHRADVIAAALGALHGLVRDLLELQAPTIAVVRGRCLGGGFEVALACDMIFAGTTAVLGVPEIALGVFPPAATALLPWRIGASRATGPVLTGHAAAAADWQATGLIELVAPPQELAAAVDRWFDAHFASRSAAALRHAAFALRSGARHHVARVLPELEDLYLNRLMRTKDAVEGIEAFLEKRPPVWSHA